MAGGGRVYGGGTGSSSLGVLLQSHRAEPSLDSLFLSGSGSRSMVSFEDGSNKPFFRSYGAADEAGIDDELDEYFNEHRPGKKRRLGVDQVQSLEKSFEVENKLEPERKVQLAKDLGLQPRQVAIWFQNRRARWKTKQMEKDYGVLQASFDGLKADYESLLKETDKLKAEVLELSEKLAKGEKEKEDSEASENSNKLCEEEEEEEEEEQPRKAIVAESEGEVSKVSTVEDMGSVKSDMFDSDSPRFADGVHSNNPLLEHGDSPYVFEADQSDLSQDEEDELSRSLLPPYIFPKLEDVDYSDPPESSCNFGFPVEDHAFWSWSY